MIPKEIWGWAGYHNTHFWNWDEKNNVFGLILSKGNSHGTSH